MTDLDEARKRHEMRLQALDHIAEVRWQRWKFSGVYGAIAAFEVFMVVVCTRWAFDGPDSDLYRFICAFGVVLNATGAWQSVRSAREAWVSLRRMELGMWFNLRLLDGLIVHGSVDPESGDCSQGCARDGTDDESAHR